MEQVQACSIGQKWQEEIYLVLRVVTGFLFFYHGYAKVFTMGMDNVTVFFTSASIPMAGLMAVIVSYGELIGGLALMLGFFTHWVTKFNVLIMLGAIYFVHLEKGYDGQSGGYEYQLLILIVCLFISAMGAGKYSLDAKFFNKQSA